LSTIEADLESIHKFVQDASLDYPKGHTSLTVQRDLLTDMLSSKWYDTIHDLNETKRMFMDLSQMTMTSSQLLEREAPKPRFWEHLPPETTPKSTKTRQRRGALGPISLVMDVVQMALGIQWRQDHKQLKALVQNLAKNQDSITSVLHDSLTFMNHTQIKMKEHQDYHSHVNKILLSIHHNITDLKNDINVAHNFASLTMRIRTLFQNLDTVLRRSQFHIEQLKQDISFASAGKLTPSTIAPRELNIILSNLAETLDHDLFLPSELDNDNIWMYYNILSTHLIHTQDAFYIFIKVPILSAASQYDLFVAHNLNVPFKGLSASYQLEFEAFAISRDRLKYSVMTPAQVAICSDPLAPFCELKTPIYPFLPYKATLCVLALFSQDPKEIHENCQVTVKESNDSRPQATYVGQGKWILAGQGPLNFDVICANDHQYHLRVEPNPLSLISLAPSCYAVNDHIILPRYYIGHSTIEKIFPPTFRYIGLGDLRVWDKAIDYMTPNYTFFLKELTNDLQKGIQMDELIHKLTEAASQWNQPKLSGLFISTFMKFSRFLIFVSMGLGAFTFLITLVGFIFYLKGDSSPSLLANCLRKCTRKRRKDRKGITSEEDSYANKLKRTLSFDWSSLQEKLPKNPSNTNNVTNPT
jgi:hypothetical protein